MSIEKYGILFNLESDTAGAHRDSGLANVLHVFDAHWHGIRSASACLPGHKASISHKSMVSGDGLLHLFSYIHSHRIEHVCFQGFSENALEVAELLKREFGSGVQLNVVTHVSAAQFEHQFEMKMLGRMIAAQERGVIRRLGSVKPRFHGVLPQFWNGTIINVPPVVKDATYLRVPESALIPMENTWRKNLYSNFLAAIRCEQIRTIYAVNWPTGLEDIADLEKVRLVGFMRPAQLVAQAAACGVIVHASLIECQPMTLLEGLAVGTPTITGPLGIHPEIDSHPFTRLGEVAYVDDVGAIQDAIGVICGLWRSDPAALGDMARDQYALRTRLGLQSYQNFLD